MSELRYEICERVVRGHRWLDLSEVRNRCYCEAQLGRPSTVQSRAGGAGLLGNGRQREARKADGSKVAAGSGQSGAVDIRIAWTADWG